MAGTRPVWIGAACVALVCFAGAGVLSRLPDVPASLDAALVAADKAHEERLRDREPAGGSGSADRAAFHYAAAIAKVADALRAMRVELVSWNDERHALSVAVAEEKGWRRLAGDELAAFRTRVAPALAAMQTGARCRDATSRVTAHEAFWLTSVAAAEVALRTADRDADAAVELWLDLATLQIDVGQMPARGWSPDEIASLPEPAADRLALGLARLDARLDEMPFSLAHELRNNVLVLRSRSPVDWNWKEVLAACDHGFDPSARHLAIHDEVIAHADILEPAAPTVEGRAAQWQLFEGVTAEFVSTSDVVAFQLRFAKMSQQGRGHTLAHLRSLRIGLAARLGRELPVLIDPTTDAPFRVDEDGAFVVVHRTAPVPPDRWVRCP